MIISNKPLCEVPDCKELQWRKEGTTPHPLSGHQWRGWGFSELSWFGYAPEIWEGIYNTSIRHTFNKINWKLQFTVYHKEISSYWRNKTGIIEDKRYLNRYIQEIIMRKGWDVGAPSESQGKCGREIPASSRHCPQ